MRPTTLRLRHRLGIALALVAACGAFGATSAPAAIFTVNQNGDVGDGVCDAITCTLREAIVAANGNGGSDGIAFNVGDGGMETITVNDALPVITGPLVINGLSQPGSITAPVVAIDGAGAGPANGLHLTAGNSTVRGLVVRGFSQRQLWLTGGGGNTVEGNYFGTDTPGLNADPGGSSLAVAEIGGGLPSEASSENTIRNNIFAEGLYLRGNGTQNNVIVGNRVGLNALGNASVWPAESLVGIGILLDSAASNRIGGTSAADRNYVAVHFDAVGIEIVNPGATGNTVIGNYIGTDATGAVAIPNRYGVRVISGPSGNTIGGTAPGSRNVISGNVGGMTPEDGDGVHINDANGNTVVGNYIGVAANGSADLGNSGDGIQVWDSTGTTIGGTTAAAGNVVSGNAGHGIFLLDADDNVIRGNRVGTNAAGSDDVANGLDGVAIQSGSNNTIGGAAAGAGNVLSGNTNQGIAVFSLGGLTPSGNTIQGNLIGTNASGSGMVSNGGAGVLVALSISTRVGGAAAGEGNVIAGNVGNGVRIAGATTTDTLVEGNRIGALADGTPLGNFLAGVLIDTGAAASKIGGLAAGAGNVIANNSTGIGTGVSIASSAGNGHSVLGNSIDGNGGLGIDLASDGLTANDEGDNDAGPNGLQNFPEITTASSAGGTVNVAGDLIGAGGTGFRIEIFLSPSCDGTHGEGRTYVGATSVTTSGEVGGPGSGSFSASFPGTAAEGDVVTATATAPDGSTSEFSACLAVTAGASAAGLTLTSDQDSVPVGVQSFPLGNLPGHQLPAYSGAPGSAPVGSIPVGSIPVGSIPVGSIPVGSIPVGSIPVGSIPVGSIPVGSIPVGSIGLGSIPVGSIPVGSIGLGEIQLSQLPVNWDAILAGTPLAEGPRQALTLADLYAPGNEAARDRYEALPFSQSGLAQSLLRGTPLSAFLLGDATLGQLPAPGGAGWCNAIAVAGGSCAGVNTATNTVLGLSIAGAPVGSIPVGSIPVGSIPVGSIPVGSIPVGSIDLEAARLANVLLSALPAPNAVVDCGRIACSGNNTLGMAKAAGALRPDATLAQLLGTDTADNTFGDVGGIILNDIILGILPRSALDWERFPLDGLQLYDGSDELVHYRLELNLPCDQAPGLQLNVKLPTGFIVKKDTSYVTYGASVPLKAGDPDTTAAAGATWPAAGAALPAPGPCFGVAGGAAQLVKLEFDAYSGFSINTRTAVASASFNNGAASLSDDDPILVTQNWESNDDPATAPVIGADALHVVHLATNRDREIFRIHVPAARGTRTTVYLSHVPEGADYDLTIGQPAAESLISAPVGSIPVGSIPVPDEGSALDNSGKTLPPETLQDIPVGSIPVGSISATRGNATEAATVVSQGESGFYTIVVSGYNGSRSPDAAMLRVTQTPPPPLPACPARTFAHAAGPAGSLPATLPASTEALFLYNRSQLVALYGAPATDAMLASLDALIGYLGNRASDPISVAKLDVSGSAAVRNAYAAWNAGPCSIDAANDVTQAINAVVAGYRSGGGLPNLEAVTLLGSDEAVPMARLRDPVTISNELDEASDLEFLTAGRTRANALYAAHALGHFLSDAPYGTLVTTPWLNRQLYLPTVAVSRLVETPLEIQRQLELFVAAQGSLNPDSALTTAYDFLTDGGEAVKAALDRFGPNGVSQGLISNAWDAAALGGVLLPTSGAPADIASVNAHYNHYLLQPAAGRTMFGTGNLPALPSDPSVEPAFARRILFTMGCHAGLNVADTLLPAGDPKLGDWAQRYAAQRAAIYVANTGFGYGDTVANALSERLMSIFGQQIGKNGSIGSDWLRSMHDYYNTMGFYGVYDEKALSEATMYGLPFWRVGSAPASPPAPDITPGAAGTVTTTVVPNSLPHPSARGTFWSEGGDTANTQHTHYRPIQPVVSLDATQPVATGVTLRGAFITALDTDELTDVDPFNALPMIDLAANEPERNFEQAFFPANFVHITRSRQGDLMRQSVEVVTGQSRPEGDGEVTERLLRSIGLQVGYSSGADLTKPLFREVGGTLTNGTLTVFADVADTVGAITEVQALVNDGASWRLVTLSGANANGLWTATLTNVAQDPEILYQARDADWNVAFTTNKGFNFRAVPNDTSGPEVHIERPLPVHTLGETVRAEFSCFDPGGVQSCTATVDGIDIANGAPLPASAMTLGPHTFTVTAVDLLGNQTPVTRPYLVTYPFGGFFQPVDNMPMLNEVKAGSTIPVKFSLGGNHGPTIFAAGYPKVLLVSCGGDAAPADPIEETTTKSGLTYDAATDRYHYNWKTDKAWAGTCRQLILRFVDGTERRATFRLK